LIFFWGYLTVFNTLILSYSTSLAWVTESVQIDHILPELQQHHVSETDCIPALHCGIHWLHPSVYSLWMVAVM